MSLVTEINRTETEKNKTKQVATQIDKKLVELGGEQATDLSDVPNKIEKMVKENFTKYAQINYGKIVSNIPSSSTSIDYYIEIPLDRELNFLPNHIEIELALARFNFSGGALTTHKSNKGVGEMTILEAEDNDYYNNIRMYVKLAEYKARKVRLLVQTDNNGYSGNLKLKVGNIMFLKIPE